MGVLKISMRVRLWTTVVIVVLLISIAQVWVAMNLSFLEEKLLAENPRFSDLDLRILDDSRALPWVIIATSMIFSVAVAYLVGTYLIRPVRVLARGVRLFAAGDLDHRVEISTGDEIEELAAVFNDMAEKIKTKTQALEEMAIRDQLTGLFNRRHLIEAMTLEKARCERHGGEFAVAIMDVDHFKAYNDREGHLAGDEALKLAARVLRESCRQIDTVARYGGEEFVVVLPNADIAAGTDAAARLRHAIAEFDFPGAARQPNGRVSISIGVAAFPTDGSEITELLATADRRLYRAKHAGRNIVAYGDDERSVTRDPPQEVALR